MKQRRVRLFVAASLDGYIATAEGGVEWLFQDQDYGLNRFMGEVDTVLLGRKTYDWMVGHGVTSYEGLRNYVFSRSQESGPDPSVQFITEDATVFVESLRLERGGDIWLVGGGQLFSSLLEAELVDEIMLAIHPVILGDGIPLFLSGLGTVPLRLDEVQSFETGLVMMSYRVERPGNR